MVGILSRVQFAFTIAFHFLFVPLSVGLIIFVAIFETIYFITGNEKYKLLSHFWSELFIISYAFGIVTGIAMTIQFGTNWANFSIFMGDVFGSPLALEALLAFFLESTFTGIWIFRRHKISSLFRLITVYMITLGTTLSAFWIITANGFMQHPVGAVNVGDKMELVSFKELSFNPYAWWIFIHNHVSAILLGGFLVVSVSAYLLLKGKKEEREAYITSIKFGTWVILITSILQPIIGNLNMKYIATVQPTKIAAISGGSPFVQSAFALMVILGILFIGLAIFTTFFRDKFLNNKVMLKVAVWMLPLPFITILAGWVVTEVGRQPWIVYGELLVSDAVSDVPVEQVWFSLISIMVYYFVLGLLNFYLMKSRIKEGFVYKGVR